MAKLSPRPTRRVLRALARAGWIPRAHKPGAKHYTLEHRQIPGILTVPRHRVTKKGTLAKIIKQAGLTVGTFEKLYR